MTVAYAQQLAVMIGLLVAAIVANAVVLARGYVQVREIVEGLNRSGVPIRGAKGTSSGVRVGGSGAVSAISSADGILSVPREAQRSDLTVSTTPAWTGSVDCGPECVVACLQYEHGQETIAQLLRLRYFGVIDMRLTNADDLVGMLRQNGVEAHSRYVDAATGLVEMPRALQMGWPALVLLRYIGGSTLHWYVVKGNPGASWVLMDPWLGVDMTVSASVLTSRWAGQYVHIDQAPAKANA